MGFRQQLDATRTVYIDGQGTLATRSNLRWQPPPSFDSTAGPVKPKTGRPLDIAIRGEGWLAVQAPDGSETYTRRGDLSIGRKWRLK